jgi:hypothetical protein
MYFLVYTQIEIVDTINGPIEVHNEVVIKCKSVTRLNRLRTRLLQDPEVVKVETYISTKIS